MILDQFNVPIEIADSIEQYVLSENIDWRFQRETINKDARNSWQEKFNFTTKVADLNILEKYWFHKLVLRIGHTGLSDFAAEETVLDVIKPLQDFIALDVIKKPVQVRRILINMFCYCSSDVIAMPHLDTDDDDAITCLYYVNNSSGDTYIFENNAKILKQIPPKKGTGVLFKSNMLHAGSYPKEELEPRVVINFMFKYL